MSEINVKELLKINDILLNSVMVDSECEGNKEKYLKILQKLNASNKHNQIASMAKAAQTYIHQSTMGINYYESLSLEMRCLIDSVSIAFDKDSEISNRYDKQIFSQIIISSYEIDYAEHSPLQTANISNVNNAYTIKPSNFTFNMYNFFKYISEIQLLATEISEKDTEALVVVALWTIAQLKSDLTKKINVECACFLRFLYNEIGFGREENEDLIIKKYLDLNKEFTPPLNDVKVREIINSLADLKVVEIVEHKVRIIEKVHM